MNMNYRKTILALTLCWYISLSATGQVTPSSQMEKLDRGLVAVKSGNKIFLSWRLLGTDTKETTFDVVRDGKTIANGLSTVTNYTDANGSVNNSYSIVTHGGPNNGTSAPITPWDNIYKDISLDQPTPGTTLSGEYTYTPNDCSVGDLDGDGEYEIVVKWMPSLQSHNWPGVISGPVILDGYKMDGTHLWRINLGKNIQACNHITEFLVYDFDGDGRSEIICKTAPGSIDGIGNYVSSAATDATIKSTDNQADYIDYSSTTDEDGKVQKYNGMVKSGPEYLTIFDGQTGAAIHTIYYRPNRQLGWGGAPEGYSDLWGDQLGNRGERYMACVAYLGGSDHLPSAVMGRGIYRLCALWAVDFDGKQLKQRWIHVSKSPTEVDCYDEQDHLTTRTYSSNTFNIIGNSYTSYTVFGQGAHSLCAGDVDGDGCDEIVYGAATVDHDGQLLYSTGRGHGDALHLGDFDPDRPGLEIYMVHEHSPFGASLYDAATGEPIWWIQANGDTGRGACFDIDANHRGAEMWCSYSGASITDIHGESISSNKPSINFRVYWDGDLQDELLDGGKLDKWTGEKPTRLYPIKNTNLYQLGKSCNDSKATPNLVADILGDWREEIILWNQDENGKCFLRLFTTNVPTTYRVPCLMHDHTYRMGIAWQNVGYNQPPHLGYYLPDLFKSDTPTAIKQERWGKMLNGFGTKWYNINGQLVKHPTNGVFIKNGKKMIP